MREASLFPAASAVGALDDAFRELPRGAGHASVLAYMIESKEPDGRVSPGFRPGYVAMVWPSDYASADWAYGHLSDGHPFSLVPRHSPVDSAASVVIDVLDAAQGTFSATPL